MIAKYSKLYLWWFLAVCVLIKFRQLIQYLLKSVTHDGKHKPKLRYISLVISTKKTIRSQCQNVTKSDRSKTGSGSQPSWTLCLIKIDLLLFSTFYPSIDNLLSDVDTFLLPCSKYLGLFYNLWLHILFKYWYTKMFFFL